MGVTSRRPRLWEAHKTRLARLSSPPFETRSRRIERVRSVWACNAQQHIHGQPYNNRGQTDLNRWIEEEEKEKEKEKEEKVRFHLGSIPFPTMRFIEESRQCCWKSNNNGANALASKNYGRDYDSTILHHRSTRFRTIYDRYIRVIIFYVCTRAPSIILQLERI